jgi:hypothetical protein
VKSKIFDSCAAHPVVSNLRLLIRAPARSTLTTAARDAGEPGGCG